MEENQVRLPDRPRYDNGKEKSLLQRFAKQIALSVIASIIAGLILNFTGIKKAVLAACSIAVHVGGDPISGKGGIIDKIEDKVGDIASKPHGRLPVGDHKPQPAAQDAGGNRNPGQAKGGRTRAEGNCRTQQAHRPRRCRRAGVRR